LFGSTIPRRLTPFDEPDREAMHGRCQRLERHGVVATEHVLIAEQVQKLVAGVSHSFISCVSDDARKLQARVAALNISL
jgi:hypothetical protein